MIAAEQFLVHVRAVLVKFVHKEYIPFRGFDHCGSILAALEKVAKTTQVIGWDRGRPRPQMSAKRENGVMASDARLRCVVGGAPAVPVIHLTFAQNRAVG